MFSTLSRREILTSATSDLLSANALNLVNYKILSFRKEYRVTCSTSFPSSLSTAFVAVVTHFCTFLTVSATSTLLAREKRMIFHSDSLFYNEQVRERQNLSGASTKLQSSNNINPLTDNGNFCLI